jgi:CheY-like chemotaxis protein
VCITVLSRHVPQFAFLNILLADEKPLELRVRFYQRLLAQDYDEAFDVAAEFLRSGSVDDLADGVLLPALALAETDRDAARLDHRQEQFVYDSITELIGDLDAQFEDAAPDAAAAAKDDDGTAPAERPSRALRVLCVGDVDEADRVSALLLGKLLAARGHVALVSDGTASGEDALELIENKNIECVVLSSVAPALGALHARRACLRLRRRFPDLKLLVGLWKAPGLLDRTRERLSRTGADAVAASLSEALGKIHAWASQEDPSHESDAGRHALSERAHVRG